MEKMPQPKHKIASKLCRWPLRDNEHVLVCWASAIGLAQYHVVVHEALASPWTPVNLSEDMPPSRSTFLSLYFDPRGHSHTGFRTRPGPLGITHYEPRIRPR
jgi:hypothetical protein